MSLEACVQAAARQKSGTQARREAPPALEARHGVITNGDHRRRRSRRRSPLLVQRDHGEGGWGVHGRVQGGRRGGSRRRHLGRHGPRGRFVGVGGGVHHSGVARPRHHAGAQREIRNGAPRRRVAKASLLRFGPSKKPGGGNGHQRGARGPRGGARGRGGAERGGERNGPVRGWGQEGGRERRARTMAGPGGGR